MVKKIFSSSQALLSREQSSILSAAVIITASSFLSALLGLLRNRLLVGNFFGDPILRAQLDAYWVAFRLPELIFQLLVIGTVSAALIPVFNKFAKNDPHEAHHVTNSVMNLALLLYLAASIIIFIFAPGLTSLITSDSFSTAQINLAAQLTRIILAAQFFFAISNFLSGIIQAQQRFLIPALSPAAYNLGIILGILLLTPYLGIYGAAIGVVFGAILHLVLQLPLAIRLGYRYSLTIDLHHQGVKDMIRLTPPRIIALGVDQIDLMIAVFFATALPTGSLTVINLAQQLMTAPTRIFSVPLGQASLPFLSKQIASGEVKQFSRTLHDSLQHIFFLAFPAGMLLLILRIPLVRIAYGASEFPWAATLLTGKAVAILSVALFAQGGTHLLVRAFYSMHNTVTPLIASVIAVAINISLSFLGVYVWGTGVLGLAFAVATAEIIHFCILCGILLKKIPDWSLTDLLKPTTKIIFASLIMGICLWLPMRLLDRYVFDTTRVIPLLMLTGIASLIGGGMYLFFAKLLSIPEYHAYMNILAKVGNWKSVLTQSPEAIEPTSPSSELTS